MTKSRNIQTRVESDSMGEIEVPEDKLWGAQTQRSLKYFSIGSEVMPIEIIHSLAHIKKACAQVNHKLGLLESSKADLIQAVAEEIIQGKHDQQFPLHVWMTGSGTQSNMNVNEVISNRACDLSDLPRGGREPLHPNDHVNKSQSSNDVFPTAIHIAVSLEIRDRLLPATRSMSHVLRKQSAAWKDIVKLGRTHLQDAVPMTLGQEFGGYASMLDNNIHRLEQCLEELSFLCLGGTAIGTGLNAPEGFDRRAIEVLSVQTGIAFQAAPDKFAAQGTHDALVAVSGHLKTLANSLIKISNDIRLLACGPRAGFAELILPANEPGSSIMPGKVNPTQCEALTMVGIQVIANDTAVTIGNSSGMLEMNVYKPLIGYNLLQSSRILSDSMQSFTEYCLKGIKPNHKQLQDLLNRSLMLVTALAPKIGYDQASKIAHHAHTNDLTLKQSALKLNAICEAEYDDAMDPAKMARPHGK
jgi:fumarate hydratase class II